MNKMERKEELEKVKEILKEKYESGDCGLYYTRNIAGDQMVNIYDGKYFKVDICYYYEYFEIFGTSEKEQKELNDFYEGLGENNVKD